MFVMFVTHILYCTLHLAITITYCSYIYNEILSCIFKINTKKIFIYCYYREMPNVTKKNLIIIKSIIVWKWNHLFTKNYFRKKKIDCYGFMPGNFQVICGSLVDENCWSPVLTETSDPQSSKLSFHVSGWRR